MKRDPIAAALDDAGAVTPGVNRLMSPHEFTELVGAQCLRILLEELEFASEDDREQARRALVKESKP